MCGRYYIDDKAVKAIRAAYPKADSPASGDICPGNTALVLTAESLREMKWGFLRPDRKGLWINARAETILERPAFRESALSRRCVVLAGGFYEWDKDRQKAVFTRPGEPVIFMAGCCRRFEDGDHFVILTTKANASVEPVHDRMPLILDRGELKLWLREDACLEAMLNKISPFLGRYQEYEQRRLPF